MKWWKKEFQTSWTFEKICSRGLLNFYYSMTHQNILLSHYINFLKFLVVYIYMRNWQNWKVYFQSLAKVSFSRRHWVKKANNWSLSYPPQHLVAEVGYRNWRQDRTATKGILYKKVFLKLSQKSQKNTCARVSFLIKLAT